MDYRIAICDDDQTQSQYLKTVVSSWAAQAAQTVSIDAYSSVKTLLNHSDLAYSIYLLDVEMPEINGIELAEKIRCRDSVAQIIFVTGYAEYIAQGYDVAALHYLLKPIDKHKLYSVLDRAIVNLGKSEAVLCIEQAGKTHRLPLKDIRYIEVLGNYVTIHAASDITLRKTLADLKGALDDRFEPTGRSFMVNLQYIRCVTRNDVLLSSGERLPLSRGMFHSLNQAIIERT